MAANQAQTAIVPQEQAQGPVKLKLSEVLIGQRAPQEQAQGSVRLKLSEVLIDRHQVKGKQRNMPLEVRQDLAVPALQTSVSLNAGSLSRNRPLASPAEVDTPPPSKPAGVGTEKVAGKAVAAEKVTHDPALPTLPVAPPAPAAAATSALVVSATEKIGTTGATWATGASPEVPAGPEAPVPFESVRPGPPAAAGAVGKPLSENLPDLAAVTSWLIPGWAIPPVRWGGTLNSMQNLNQSPEGGKSYNQIRLLNIQAASYIYQPWFAQVSGDVGLLKGSSWQAGGSSSGGPTSARNEAITYNGNLNLFPLSRFPFQAFVQTSDSRASANAQGQHSSALRMGASQAYRPEVGPENYSGNVDRSIVATRNQLNIVDALAGTFSTTMADHGLSANARFSRNIGDIGGQGSQLFSAAASHSWHSEEELTIASSANFINNQISVLIPTGLIMNNSQILQASSSLSWLPDEDLPLTVVGGGSFMHMTTKTEKDQTGLVFLNGFANANYRFNQNLNATAGMGMTQSLSQDDRQGFFTQDASVSYSGNPLVFGNYNYNWGGAGGVNNQVSSGGSSRSLSSSIQHSLLRSILLGETSNVTLNASQSLALSSNTMGQNTALTNAGGVFWRLDIGEVTKGTFSTTVTDSQSFGNYASHSRSLSVQSNLQTQFGSRSALSASVSLMQSQQLSTPQSTPTLITAPPKGSRATSNSAPSNSTPSNGGTSTLNGSGQVSYSHRSPFNISNLIYAATLQFNASQSNLRLVSGNPDAMAWQTGTVLQNNLDYRIGRLTFRATNSFANQNGKKNASIFFSASREFGDF